MLKAYIRDRKKIYFDGQAASVTSINDTGEFDILSNHAAFTSLIRDFVTVDKGLPTEKKFEVEKGVLNVKNDNLRVYVGFELDDKAIF